MKDSHTSNKAKLALSPAVQAAAINGPAIDTLGFDSALFLINSGAVAGAGDFGVKLQESDTTTSGDFTDVAAADRLGSVPATLAADSTYQIGYIGSKRKRYVRLAVTKAGGTSIALGASVVLGVPHIAQA